MRRQCWTRRTRVYVAKRALMLQHTRLTYVGADAHCPSLCSDSLDWHLQSDDDSDEDDAAFERYKQERIAFVQNSLSVRLQSLAVRLMWRLIHSPLCRCCTVLA